MSESAARNGCTFFAVVFVFHGNKRSVAIYSWERFFCSFMGKTAEICRVSDIVSVTYRASKN